MKKCKIAITDDTGLGQRSLIRLAEFNNIELVLIQRKITNPKDKNKHLEQVHDIIQNVDAVILPGNANDINPAH